MKNDKFKCPYCGRKIEYGTRILEHNKGEHFCIHCQKISTVKQDPNIWMILVICIVFSLMVMVFYLTSGNSIQNLYDEEGKLKFLVSLFFGNLMILKWILWEIIPFIIFYFTAPQFLSFRPQKRFMEQTQTKIDLSVPFTSAPSKTKSSANNRNIDRTRKTSFNGVYEDISSSSGNMDKTRSFNVSDAAEKISDVSRESFSKSQSYSSDAPLVRVSREPEVEIDEEVKEYIKEYIPSKEKIQEKISVQKEKATTPSNYSANRKF